MKLSAFIFFLYLPFSVNAQIITRFAGGGTIVGDGGPATSASINDAVKGVFDKKGNYYVADLDGYRIRKVDTEGIITTIAGTGMLGETGDGGQATSAKLNSPASVALDSNGNIYICENVGNRVRRVDKITGIITTIVGTGVTGSTGDGGPATAATLTDPQDICFDKYNNLYISEWSSRIRKVNIFGIISTFAGTGIPGYSGDGGLADTSKIGGPEGLCTDIFGNVYIADNSNSRIFKINTDGIISTVAGTDTGYLFDGDGIPATTANIDPYKIVIDDTGNLYIAEFQNYRVRKVNTTGIIYTVAGIGTPGQSGDGGPATAAQFDYPSGVALDACGNLYITEASHNGLVHKVTFNPTCDPYSHFDSASLNVKTIKEGTINIYPNPAYNSITVSSAEPLSAISISNLIGQTVLYNKCNEEKEEINLTPLPTGVYIIKVTNHSGNTTISKIIKQ